MHQVRRDRKGNRELVGRQGKKDHLERQDHQVMREEEDLGEWR